MRKYFKQFSIIILGVLFLLGCSPDDGEDKKNTPPPQEEESSNSNNLEDNTNNQNEELENNSNPNNNNLQDDTSSNNSTNGTVEKTEYHEVFAERTVIIDIDVPFEIGSIDYLKSTEHKSYMRKTKVDKENKQFIYSPEGGFVGQEESKYRYWNKEKTNSITIIYKIDVKKPLLEGNRDFSIASRCQFENTYLEYTRIHRFDIDVVNSTLDRIENLYDNKKENSSYLRNPYYSRIAVDYFADALYDDEKFQFSKNYHDSFKNNLDKMALVTCNYTNGYLRSILPINSEKWYANKPRNNIYSANFIKNDLLFYVSLLSELHTQIYLKEYSHTFNKKDALQNADSFMDKVFPDSHYKVEYQTPYYESGVLGRLERLDYLAQNENTIYYKKLKLLADTINSGDILKTLTAIAENYESYYTSGNHECKNSVICGTIFPEYTESVTSNSEFKNSLEPWNKIENIDSSIGSGKVDYFPTKNKVAIELAVNRPNGSDTPSLDIDIYQTEPLANNKTIDDYFFNFDVDYVHGGSASPFGGYESSGLSGVYTCFRDANNKQLGCLSWSDHINKYYIFKILGAHIMKNNDKFYNIELYPIVRRVKHNLKEGFVENIALGATLKKYLPTVYEQDIKYIEYGMFATEFRNQYGGCKECVAKVIANKINLEVKK